MKMGLRKAFHRRPARGDGRHVSPSRIDRHSSGLQLFNLVRTVPTGSTPSTPRQRIQGHGNSHAVGSTPKKRLYYAMTQSKTAARRLLSATNVNSCSICTTTTTSSRLYSSISSSPTTLVFRRKVLATSTLAHPVQVRRYAQPATAPSPDAYEESSTRNPASNKDAAQFPFPSKKNPSPYEIMHLPMSADPKDIKQRCKLTF